MGGVGALLAAAAEPRTGAAVAMSTPADPYRLTRQTFRLARLPIPDPIAYPLAWLTTRVYLRPRGHTVASISAARAVAAYRGPLLLLHGAEDTVVPPSHLERLARAARAARRGVDEAPVETSIVEGGHHSWLYESPAYRATVAAVPGHAPRRPADARRGGRAGGGGARDPASPTRCAALRRRGGAGRIPVPRGDRRSPGPTDHG